MDRDSEQIMWDFSVNPKEKLHMELLSLRNPWIMAVYVGELWRESEIDDDGNVVIAPCVFDGLAWRMQWPQIRDEHWLRYLG